jgi:hypothetical protein
VAVQSFDKHLYMSDKNIEGFRKQTVHGLEGKMSRNVPLILSVSQWNELNGSSTGILRSTGDRSFQLDLWRLQKPDEGLGVVRIYVTFHKDST